MVIGIGNTAEYGPSGLNDGQAAGLLSAVSGYGLPVVEPGCPSDPVAAGLNAAINRAYHLWIEQQPQLILELWPRDDDGLEEAQSSALRLLEPARNAPLTAHSPAGGLNNGAEPCCGTHEGLTASGPAAADTASPVSSAPSQHYGGCRISPEESRGSRQRGV